MEGSSLYFENDDCNGGFSCSNPVGMLVVSSDLERPLTDSGRLLFDRGLDGGREGGLGGNGTSVLLFLHPAVKSSSILTAFCRARPWDLAPLNLFLSNDELDVGLCLDGGLSRTTSFEQMGLSTDLLVPGLFPHLDGGLLGFVPK